MKSTILSFLGIGAIAFAVACNSASDESTNKDSATNSTMDNSASVGTSSVSGDIQTSTDGRKFVLRKRSSSGTSASAASGTTASTGNDYDTVWLYMGTQDRYYTLHGPSERDTLYFNTDEWNAWWSNTETDNELKSKSADSKVKIDDDGSWKVKDDNSKTKMNEKGDVKTKPKG